MSRPVRSRPHLRRGHQSSGQGSLHALEHVPRWLDISGRILAVLPRSRMFQALLGRAPSGNLFQGKPGRILSLRGGDEVGIPNPSIPSPPLTPGATRFRGAPVAQRGLHTNELPGGHRLRSLTPAVRSWPDAAQNSSCLSLTVQSENSTCASLALSSGPTPSP